MTRDTLEDASDETQDAISTAEFDPDNPTSSTYRPPRQHQWQHSCLQIIEYNTEDSTPVNHLSWSSLLSDHTTPYLLLFMLCSRQRLIPVKFHFNIWNCGRSIHQKFAMPRKSNLAPFASHTTGHRMVKPSGGRRNVFVQRNKLLDSLAVQSKFISCNVPRYDSICRSLHASPFHVVPACSEF